jgi:SAM-dependent methyltransferase
MTRSVADVLRYFDERLDTYGSSVLAVDWASEASQALRFRVLTEIGSLDGGTVLDVGSGLGDLAAFLEQRHPTARYEGWDLNPRMVERARMLHPRARFLVADPLADGTGGAWDWILASGIFHLRDEAFLRLMVAKLFAWARRGAAFNALSAWAPSPVPDAFHAEPAQVLDFCRTLTPRVALRHDYLPHDFTVYLYRDA